MMAEFSFRIASCSVLIQSYSYHTFLCRNFLQSEAQAPNLTRAGGNDRAVDNLIKKCVRTRKKVPL